VISWVVTVVPLLVGYVFRVAWVGVRYAVAGVASRQHLPWRLAGHAFVVVDERLAHRSNQMLDAPEIGIVSRTLAG